MHSDLADTARTGIDRRPFSLLAWSSIGAAAALAGLLPWLVTGARLPLQNLAADQSTTATPFALLPFSQYFLTSIVALVVVGAAMSGLALRMLARRRPRWGTTATVAGTLAVQLLAAAQATAVTVGFLEHSRRTLIYAVAVVAVIVVSMLVGLLVLTLIASPRVPGAAIALSLVAVVSASWVDTALRDAMMFGPAPLTEALLFVSRWLPAVLVGCVIAWCGVHSAARIVASVVSLAALWIGPAFFTAVTVAAGTRVLVPYPAELVDYGRQVFISALTMPDLVIPPLVMATVIGLVGTGVLALVRQRSSLPG